MDFTRDNFPGFTRGAESLMSTLMPERRTSRDRRTSTKKVTIKEHDSSPTKAKRTKRKSKKTSPRSKILKNVSKGFRRLSPRRIKNKYARDLAEFVQALSPAMIAALSFYLYTLYEPKKEDSSPE